jgi:hypothetical protein
MPDEPRLRALIDAVQEQMLIDFERRSRQVPQMAERGGAREDYVRAFLRDHLPGRFGVASGFVFDASGGVSDQLDCIVYDKLAAPIFPVSDTRRLIPIECVSGVVSIKSTLTLAELRNAHSNVLSAVRLDRFAGGRLNAMYGGVPSDAQHVGAGPGEPIFGAIFAFDSPSIESVAVNLHGLNEALVPRERIGLIGVLGKGVVSQIDDSRRFEPTYESTARVALCEDARAALFLFYAILANQVTRRVPVFLSYLRYLGVTAARVRVVDHDGVLTDP